MHLSFRFATPEHQRPLPHAGFGPEHHHHPPHSVSSTVSCISLSIGPPLTLFPLPPSWQITPRPPESTAGRPPPLNTASSMTHHHGASSTQPPCPTATPHDAGAWGADLITPKLPMSSCRPRHRGRPGRGDRPVGTPTLRCWHGPARPAMPLD
jgi:hypothetical protein